jgi:hypothetical protein
MLQRRTAAFGGGRSGVTLESQLADIERKIDRAVKAVIDGQITRDEAERHLPALRTQRAQLAARLVTIEKPAPVITLRPALVEAYLADLARLDEVVNGDLAPGDDRAAKAIRALVDTVTVVPMATGKTPGILLRGRLNSLLGLDPFPGGSLIGGPGGAG